MELAKDTFDRIFAAADALYDQSGRAGFPTVDAVRKTARVNMNDASTGMKQWRRAQMAQAAPVAVPVPEGVQQANTVALAVLWRDAQELASESLRAAQTGWEAERAESDTLNKQMADAYEAKAAELEAAQAAIVQLQTDAGHAAADRVRLDDALDAARGDLAAAKEATERFEARVIEIERRASELRTELDHAHHDAGRVQAELAGMRQDHAKEVETLRSDLAAAHAKGEGERDKAQKEASQAREEAATLRGQVSAMKEQNAALFWMTPKPGATDEAQDRR
jgi:DNA repair exonuclease SbcCD ATPase subunit